MKYRLLIIILLCCSELFSQTLTETQKLYSLCKVWGFLKYHHPQVAEGKFDWDAQLFSKLDEVNNINTKQELNILYQQWIDGLGDVPVKVLKVSKADTAFKNSDELWMDDSTFFSVGISNKLHYIFNNRFQGKHNYINYNPNYGRLIFKGVEKVYPIQGFPNKKYRMLTLFRFWNIINYYYPYKYLIDENWDSVLIDFIPQFSAVNTEVSYHQAVAKLVAAIDDGHGSYYGFSKLQKIIYGKYIPPFGVKIVNDTVVVKWVNKNVASITTGDIITGLNNKPIADMMKEKQQYIGASNNSWRNFVLSMYLFWGNDSIISVSYQHNGQSLSTQLTMDTLRGQLTFKEIKQNIRAYKKYRSGRADKLINGVPYIKMSKIKYTNIGGVFRRYKAAPVMIIDCRNYPTTQTLYFMYKLGVLSHKSNSATIVDANLPGNFIADTTDEKVKQFKQRYKGKLILLADENVVSWGESNILLLQTIPGTLTIGCQTAGADGDVGEVPLPVGGFVGFSSIGYYYPNFVQLQRKGVHIDIPVTYTTQGVREGKDEILERALEYVKTGK